MPGYHYGVFGLWHPDDLDEVPAPFDFVAHLKRQQEFSLAAFGPGKRAAGIANHIEKELAEVRADPGNPEEWLDIAVLAIDAAIRSGTSPGQIPALLIAKLERNKNRTWPDWRTMSEDAAIEHDRAPKVTRR